MGHGSLASAGEAALDDAQETRALSDQAMVLVGHVNVVGDYADGAGQHQARENQGEIL
jgi:hypothetical protein